MKNLFSKEMGKITAVITDLALIFRSPRSFFKKISDEEFGNLARRLILYYFCFDLLILALFFPIIGTTAGITPFTLFIISLAELLLACIYAPAFILSSRFASPRISIKLAVLYPLIAKIVLILPSVVAYSFYLLTENIMLVFVRGSFLYAYLLLLPIVFPFIPLRPVRQRLRVIAASLVLIIGTNFLIGAFATNFFRKEPSEKVKYMLLSFDPIGYEYRKYILPIDMDQHSIRFTVSMLRNIVDSARPIESGYFLSEINITRISLDYASQFSIAEKKLAERNRELQEILSSLKFDTNKELVGLLIKETEIGQEVVQLASNSPLYLIQHANSIIDKNTEYLDRHIDFLKAAHSAISIRIIAMDLGMIYF